MAAPKDGGRTSPSWHRGRFSAATFPGWGNGVAVRRIAKLNRALSNLRGFAIVMVVAFHSCIAYLSTQPDAALPFDSPPYGWRANPIVDSARWLGFDLFCAFTYLYLMQLMFFLSGLFVWPSLSRKGGRKFLYD